jgi:hypothetical protein
MKIFNAIPSDCPVIGGFCIGSAEWQRREPCSE